MLNHFTTIELATERRVVKAIALTLFRAYRVAARDAAGLPEALRALAKDIGDAWRESADR